MNALALLYTDPGSGALLLQVLLGAVAGLFYYKRRLFTWLSRKKSE